MADPACEDGDGTLLLGEETVLVARVGCRWLSAALARGIIRMMAHALTPRWWRCDRSQVGRPERQTR